MSSHIATLSHLGATFYLRSTVWIRDLDRATVFASQEEAQAGLDKAKKFMPLARMKKATRIEALPDREG